MSREPAGGAAGQSSRLLGRIVCIAAGNARQQGAALCVDFAKAAIASARRILSYGWRSGHRRLGLTKAARGKRVRLVCGTTSMYTGLDGLMAIIRCHLRCDPCDGSNYVFCDAMGSKLKYIEWDGQSFRQGKRRAQSGTYPWLKGEPGCVVEISEKDLSIF